MRANRNTPKRICNVAAKIGLLRAHTTVRRTEHKYTTVL